jgi:hypothetical protein
LIEAVLEICCDDILIAANLIDGVLDMTGGSWFLINKVADLVETKDKPVKFCLFTIEPKLTKPTDFSPEYFPTS